MSSSRSVLVGARSFDCEVVDYQTTSGDPAYYNNHVFTVKVWVQQHMYAVDRSYAAFCELDSRLRKQYARSNIPILKLAGAALLPKITKNLSSLKDSKKILTYPPEQDSDLNNLRLFRRTDTTEVISQKKKYLTTYLQALLKIPEVVLSDILLYFLDEESVHGEPVLETPDDQADSREVMLLLTGLEMVTRMVRADRRQEVQVPANSVVLWSFNTLNHDVGFSVTYKDKEILKYQRYDSHLKLIKGHFEMPTAGVVTFIWDNSYSRWRSKTVNYVIRVATLEEYEEAHTVALQQKKDKMLFAKQRAMIRNSLAGLSTSILAAKGNIIAATAIPTAHISSSNTTITSPSSSLSVEHRNAMHERVDSFGSLDISTSGNSSPTPSSKDGGGAERGRGGGGGRIGGGESGNNGEYTDLSDALREIARLKNEKKTLQQALGESETALVTERSITARYIEQYEHSEQKSAALTEELNQLKVEFDMFRENYFNEMEAKLAQTLATFETRGSTPEHHSSTSSEKANSESTAPLKKESSSHGDTFTHKRDGEAAKVADVADKGAFSFHLHASSLELGHRQASSELNSTETCDSADNDTADDPDSNSSLPPAEVSLNHLINFSAAELSAMSASTLAAYYAKLNEYTQQMLKRGYLTKEMDSLLHRLKNEKKQLKAYAIQMKQSLDTLTTRYIHMDQDRALLLGQVSELRDIVALLETDRRGLRETISQMLAGDTAPSNYKNMRTSSGEDQENDASQSGTRDSTDGSASDCSRNSSLGGRVPRRGSRANDSYNSPNHSHSSSSMSLGIWSTLNSGIASATASANAVLSSVVFDDQAPPPPPFPPQASHQSSFSPPPPQQEASHTSHHRSPVRTAVPLLYTASSDSNEDTYVLSKDGQDKTASAAAVSGITSKIVISMEDLKHAQGLHELQEGGPTLNALRNWRGDVEDTGSDCGYSVQDDQSEVEAEAGGALLSSGSFFEVPNSSSASAVGESTEHASHDNPNTARARDDESVVNNDANYNGYNKNGTQGSASTDSGDGSSGGGGGMPFTRVTEQLYGILPTWGQLRKLRSESII